MTDTHLTPPSLPACEFITAQAWRRFFVHDPRQSLEITAPLLVSGDQCSRKDALVAWFWRKLGARQHPDSLRSAAALASKAYAHPSTVVSGLGIRVSEQLLHELLSQSLLP